MRKAKTLWGHQISEVAKVNFKSEKVIHLLRSGKIAQASQCIKNVVIEYCNTNNIRVKVALFTAQALCHVANKQAAQIEESKRTLSELLINTKKFPAYHEDVLRTLIKICNDGEEDQRLVFEYLQQLREHIISQKHKHFFSRSAREASWVVIDREHLLNPTYRIPLWISREEDDRKPYGESDEPMVVGRNEQLEAICTDLAQRTSVEGEVALRSSDYDIAENWAVAAEFSTGRTGRHCFQVGKLAGAIASSLGKSRDYCVSVELVCRLHDIGMIAANDSFLKNTNEVRICEYSMMREHTVAGARLLDSFQDPMMQRAISVAVGHHEWWNGCGYPAGLRGEEIPLEARICAVADTYDTFINPSDGSSAWTHEEAVRQVCAMAGVQLDPGLISPFLLAVEWQAAAKERVAEEVDQSMGRNQLARAKKRLFETLELLD